MMSDKNDDLIDKYLHNKASESEKQRIQASPELQEELAFRQDLQGALREESKHLMKQHFIQLDQKIVTRRRRLFLALGMIIAIILLSLFLWQPTPTLTNEKIFATHFEPYPNIVAPIVKGSEPTSKREEAFQFYEQSNYEKAFPLFNELAVTDTIALFYQSIILLETNKTNQSIDGFKIIAQSSKTSFNLVSEWYLALAYLKNDNRTTAIDFLEKIEQNSAHPFHKKAKTLLKALY